MAFPEYVPTRVVTVGGAMSVENADSLLKVAVDIRSSHSLIWDATGYRFEKTGKTVTGELGTEVSVVLPRTDVDGWKDAATGAIIDVSEPDSYTHRYTAVIRFIDQTGRTVGTTYTVGPFVLPAGTGAVDLDKMVPASSVPGGQVSIPDVWGQMVAAAEAAAASAQAALVDSDAFIASQIETPGTETNDKLTATIDAQMGTVVKGLYQRTNISWRALAVDPNVTGRVWGQDASGISYRNNHGTTAKVVKSALPSSQSGVQMVFADAQPYVFLVTSGNASRLGQVWRSPAPDANGDGLTWTKIFDLTGGTTTPSGGVDGGEQSYFREQSFALDGQLGYILEYGATIPGGPSIYYTANAFASSMLWTKRHTWAGGKHGHGIRKVGSYVFAMIGDAGFEDIGLWRAPSVGTPWSRSSIYGELDGGNSLYGINIHPATIGGAPVFLTDNDTKQHASVLLFGDQGTKALPLVRFATAPVPWGLGTVRQVTVSAEGNVYWVQTGENGAVGPYDSIWMARLNRPEVPVMLESLPSTNSLGTLGPSVESGDYIFIGINRVRKELFAEQ